MPSNSVSQLKAAIDRQPVSVSVAASSTAFGSYSHGILTHGCGHDVDHAVLAVGYGQSSSGKEYYIVKNSWTTSWGEDGYVRIAVKDGEGVCSIQSDSSYPSTD